MKKKALYKQIEDYLQGQIERAEYEVGAQIPTEEDLCRQFGVSKMTVTQALMSLVRKGLIYRTPGRGSFVRMRYPEGEARRLFFDQDALFHSAAKVSFRPAEDGMVERAEVPGLPERGHLELPEGDLFQRIVRKVFLGRTQLGAEYTYLPAGAVREIDLCADRSAADCLEQEAGLPVVRRETRLRALGGRDNPEGAEGPVLRANLCAFGGTGAVLFTSLTLYYDGRPCCFTGWERRPDERERARYSEIEGRIRRAIEAGEWPVGSRIPTEAELCEQFQVSRMTLRRGMEGAVEAGIIGRTPKAGSFVLRKPLAERSVDCRFSGESMEEEVIPLSSEVLSAEQEPRVAAALGLSGGYLYRIVRQRRVEGMKRCTERVTLPAGAVPILDLQDTGKGLGAQLERFDLRAARREYRISASLTPDAEWEQERKPALRVETTTFTQNGQPFLFAEAVYPNAPGDFVIAETDGAR